MRILVITLDYPPSFCSTGVLVRQLVQEFQRRGHVVTVVTSVAEGSEVSRRGWSSDGEARVLRLPLPKFRESDSTFARLLVFGCFNVLSFVAGIFSGPQDVIYAPSPPFTNGLVTWLLGRLRRIPSVYNVQDFQTEAYVQFGVLRNPFLIRVFRAMERFACAANTRVTVLAQSWCEYLKGEGVDPGSIAVVHNFVDIEEIRPLPATNGFSRRHDFNARFVVMHAGTIAFRHGLGVLVEAAALLGDLPDVLFVIVGGGSKHEELEGQVEKAQLPNLVLLPWQSRADLPYVRAAADVHMIVLRRGMTTHSVPCKVYEIMASGRPFIAAVDADSEIDLIASQVDCGIVVEPESAKAIADAVRRLHGDRKMAREMGEIGRGEAVARYSVTTSADQYEALFEEILESRKPSPRST